MASVEAEKIVGVCKKIRLNHTCFAGPLTVFIKLMAGFEAEQSA